MSEPVILVLLAAVVVALLALPLLRRRGDASPAPRAASIPRAEMADDDPAAIALREIELDREMGKLSEADYLALRKKYATSGQPRPAPSDPVPADSGDHVPAAAASASPGAHGGPPSEEALERRAEALVRRWREQSVRCPDCGDRPEPDARYCSRCGRVLVPCPKCGSTVNEPGARFCTRCGAAIAA